MKRNPLSAWFWGERISKDHGVEPLLQGESAGIVERPGNDEVAELTLGEPHFRGDA